MNIEVFAPRRNSKKFVALLPLVEAVDLASTDRSLWFFLRGALRGADEFLAMVAGTPL